LISVATPIRMPRGSLQPQQKQKTDQRLRVEDPAADRTFPVHGSDHSSTTNHVSTVRVVLASHVETELVEQMRAVDPRLEVCFEPELLPPPLYPSDHRGDPGFSRTPTQESRFAELIAGAEVLYGFPREDPAQLAWAVRLAPRLRFVQCMFAGAGQQIRAAELTEAELERIVFTSSAGVHATPLAEWSLFGLLALRKGLPRLQADSRKRAWPHYPVPELRGETLLVVGLGEIGREVARLGAAFGMRVVGVRRRPAAVEHVDEVHPPDRLDELAATADAIVITLPLTDETEGLVSRRTIEALKPTAVLVNVGRGTVVDEEALIDALREHRIAGAALDVFAVEPLPPENPLWELENVIVSPHTAALSIHENERIVALFLRNLRRYLDGETLLSRIRTDGQYY
jgi:phosphoglycerate dehydrogenase-like enzyme